MSSSENFDLILFVDFCCVNPKINRFFFFTGSTFLSLFFFLKKKRLCDRA
ncbi:hypothetical protein MtrunA17_Chr8g0350651 [Medicago truncatula]|uniref:Transmembrane protein n=1 Tax=Medicago truncatula TaxID=3880 RepID=A0A396GIR0_MEDTR|nr:hypothetical protein MtrunA17_Chr8g0350651 [Medicago truncatula]